MDNFYFTKKIKECVDPMDVNSQCREWVTSKYVLFVENHSIVRDILLNTIIILQPTLKRLLGIPNPRLVWSSIGEKKRTEVSASSTENTLEVTGGGVSGETLAAKNVKVVLNK